MKKQFLLISYFVVLVALFGCQKTNSITNNNGQVTARSVTALATSSTLLGQNSTWKYLDDGSNQGTAWRAASFNDGAWKSGAGQFGFGDGDESTVLQSGFITYYFRKHINITDVNALPDTVSLAIIHDDAAVVYINGTEAVRTALLPQTGAIGYTTGTSTFIPTAQENNYFTYKIPKSRFQTGDNVIAIEVHNQNTSSSDISFDCYIKEFGTSDPDGPYVFLRNNTYTVKSIDREQGFVTQSFSTRAQVQLTVELPNGDNFAVNLKPQLISREPAEFTTLPSKHFITSDIEGGIDGFILMLKKANIIDANYNWSYGNGHLFILGDVFDSGKYVTQCLWLIYKLEQEAAIAGGKVHFILGNHDMMNMIGDYRYVNEKYTANTQTIGETYAALYGADSELGKWLRSKNIIEKAGNTIFLHAGISPEVAALNQSVTTLNTYVNPVINGTCTATSCKTATGSTYGLYWYRDMAKQLITQAQVNSILSTFNAERVFVGHTILNNQITPLYGDKVIAIDLEHADNYPQGYMEGVYYNNGCYFKFHTTATTATYTPIIGSNCTP